MAEDEAESKRLAELERRWREEPGARVFLQLAEEYRRTGRAEDALEVLEKELEKNPQHVAAQVARGRCLLELERSEEAVRTLDTVLDQDAAHLVARKLLVETHIRRGDAPAARRQLDLYTNFAGADPEVDELRQRIQGLLLADAEPVPEASAAGEAAAAGEPPPPTAEASRRLSSLPAAEPFPGLGRELQGRLANGAGDVFSDSRHRAAPAAADPAAAAPEAGPPAAPESSSGLAGEPARDDDDDTLPLGLGPMISARGAESEAPEGPGDGGVAALGDGEPPAVSVAEEAAAEEPPATVTLGQLYLRQGHVTEARRIFQRVLESDPGNPAAREGLASLAGDQAAAEQDPPQGLLLAQRKVQALERYLALLRRGVERDVP